MKKIYCYGPGFHTYIKNLAKNPPEGYQILLDEDLSKKGKIETLKKIPFVRFIYKNFIKKFFNTFHILNKVYSSNSPKDADLILSTGQIISEKKPWIIEILDSPFSMAGNDYNLFLKNLKNIKKALESDYCKYIIIHTRDSGKIMKRYFSEKIIKKLVLLPPSIISDKPLKNNFNKRLNILFLGSINNPDEFFMKGGIETLEVFKIPAIKNKVSLIMRCRIPEEIKNRYDLSGIKLIENELPIEELNNLYSDSDVFLSPGYTYFVMVFLESMNYSLPIIALDTYGVRDFVKNNLNGYLIKPSNNLPINIPEYPSNIRSQKFWNLLKTPDKRVIADLSKAILKLANNRKQLSKLSKSGKKFLEKKISFKKRNLVLKRVFDNALA